MIETYIVIHVSPNLPTTKTSRMKIRDSYTNTQLINFTYILVSLKAYVPIFAITESEADITITK